MPFSLFSKEGGTGSRILPILSILFILPALCLLPFQHNDTLLYLYPFSTSSAAVIYEP